MEQFSYVICVLKLAACNCCSYNSDCLCHVKVGQVKEERGQDGDFKHGCFKDTSYIRQLYSPVAAFMSELEIFLEGYKSDIINILVPYGFDWDMVDQSTKSPLDF